MQETFTKFLATIESEKKERENRNEQDLSRYKQKLRDDYKEAVQEIQTQAQLDRKEDMSTHTTLLGQIKTFQSDIAIFKKSIASLQSENGTYRKNIASLQAESNVVRDDYRRLDKDLTKIYDKVADFKDEVRACKFEPTPSALLP